MRRVSGLVTLLVLGGCDKSSDATPNKTSTPKRIEVQPFCTLAASTYYSASNHKGRNIQINALVALDGAETMTATAGPKYKVGDRIPMRVLATLSCETFV